MISAFPRFRPAADARSRMQLLGTDGAGLPIVLIRNYDGKRGDTLASDVEKALGIHMVHQDPQRNISGCGGAAQTDAPSDKYQIIKGIINYEFVHGEEYVDSCKALDMAGRDFVANALSLIEPHLCEASTLAALPALDALPTTARPLGKDSVDKDSKPSRVETQVLSYPAGTAEVGYHPHVDKTGTRWVALASLGTAPCDFFWDIARPDKQRRSCAAGSSGFNAGSCERWDPDAASRHGSKGRPTKLKGGKAADRVPCRSCRTVTMAPGDVLVFCGEPFSSRVVHGVDSVGASDPLREAAVNAAGLGWLRGRRISLLARGANHRERIVESDQMHEHCTAEYLQRAKELLALLRTTGEATERRLAVRGSSFSGDQKLMQFAKKAADRDDVAADRTPGRSRRQRNCHNFSDDEKRRVGLRVM
ncbi:hypothetical protein EMIHUDRAFT_457685 [Emiliania huxleyi CCMP1516]|uniref:Fe2OG dioxygenase domain-containing protein n=2 Tax=Emiliania huxleyi TaxID=2903 RepID=A0A0D3JMX2_EMIH1|nr:hypothetical protein EMIHUDRAFT_457685 [Emiliania huxleyi CCMP1516]EOD24857.1 hypothetical protein EMIHUDRAFT_457685 [Emiliania huxleyi CCMP1516]|eukprot:XP_005777286.1 hypothetical protein EMIHUDRAFT_457685 [Emiliania huxleyi CCMP1516]